MSVIKVSATFSADATTTMTTIGTAGYVNNAPAHTGVLLDVQLSASADTSVAVSIADATGTVFTVASADFTTATLYKNSNAAIVRNGFTGQLAATITGLGSGTFTVTAWIKTD